MILSGAGVEIPDWHLQDVMDVSADGTHVIGSAVYGGPEPWYPRAFIVRLPQ